MKAVGEPDAGELQIRFDEGLLSNVRSLLYSITQMQANNTTHSTGTQNGKSPNFTATFTRFPEYPTITNT